MYTRKFVTDRFTGNPLKPGAYGLFYRIVFVRERGGGAVLFFFLSPRTIVRMRAARGLPGPFNEKAAPSSAMVIRAAGTVGVSQRDVDVVYTYVIFGRDHRTR